MNSVISGEVEPTREMLLGASEQVIGHFLPPEAGRVTAYKGLLTVTGIASDLWTRSDIGPESIREGAEYLAGLLGRYREDALREMDLGDFSRQLSQGNTDQVRDSIGEVIKVTGDYMANGALEGKVSWALINGLYCRISPGVKSKGSSLEIPVSMTRKAAEVFPVGTQVAPRDTTDPIPLLGYLQGVVTGSTSTR